MTESFFLATFGEMSIKILKKNDLISSIDTCIVTFFVVFFFLLE